ncbi:MAG TPA: OmpA family protein [Stellaceae bacterium]|nr:OmpA family protein [Stellaceae bacterium]
MRAFAAIVIVLALAACSRQALFVVLPNPDGSAGQITVDDGKTQTPLDQPYAASEVRNGTAKVATVDAPQVQQIFGQAIAARPILPTHFRLYFISDSDTLTPDSQKLYASVFDDIKRRPVYQVEVVGHTDTLGDKTYNQQLSLRRAQALRARLAKDGLTMTAISAAGRGSLDLAVKTPDQTSEPRNRRVEITVQ